MIKTRNRKPLTAEEKRFFFEWSLYPKSSAFNNNLQFELIGRLRINILKKALYELTNKHEILRSIFHIDSKKEERIILSNYKPDLNIVHLIKQTKSQKSLLSNFFLEPFSLTITPPHKYLLIKVKKDNYTLALSWHHIIVDAFAVQILLKDLADFYNNYLQRSSSLPNVKAIGIVSSQKESFLSNISYEQVLDYWYKQLISKPNYVNIKEYTEKNKIGERHYYILSEKLTQKLMHLIGISHSTLFTTLATIFNILFFHYTNQQQITLGYAVSNRNIYSLDLVGCFVNILPLATEVSNNSTYIELLEHIKLCINENIKNKHISLLDLVKMLREKKVEFNKLPFNVQLNQTTSVSFSLELQEIESRIVHIKKFEMQPENDLVIRFDYFNKKILIEFEIVYSPSLIKFIKQFIKSLKLVVKTIIYNPDIIIKDIPIITQYDKKKLLIEWNQTDKVYPDNKIIHELFEEQVERTPNNIAVVYEDTRLTYQELNERANQLVNQIRQNHDIQPDTLIALCLDRSEHMLIAILAVLKAGGAYVPMDPGYPDERIKYIIEDTDAKLILTNEVHKQRLEYISLPSSTTTTNQEGIKLNPHREILAIDSAALKKQLSLQFTTNPIIKTKSTDLAYVIYTSGTTGQPKGVMIEHRGVVNRIKWMNDMYPLNEVDKILQKTSYVFDVSVWELLWAIWYGGCLVFAKPEEHKNVNYIVDLMNKESITITHFVPSMLSIFEDTVSANIEQLYLNKDNLIPSLRYIFCSGEKLNLTQVQTCHNLLPYAEIHNLYGPTEVSIDALYYDCTDKNIKAIYIGKPINNTKAYVLNRNLTPLPIGAIGELYIGGVGLARGYLNRPELTAEKFIDNPFQTKDEKRKNKNTRLYKTGDLVRLLPDGNLEYIGRNDFQVKIRGYRIELAEIENVLSNYQGIGQNIVVAKHHTNGNKYLIGYYSTNKKLDETTIIKYLKLKLPQYMIPNKLIHVKKWPLTINGKIDRLALPEPQTLNNDIYIQPKSFLEKQIAKIWEELLEIKRVGIYDNFFSLGGDSLLAIRMVMLAQKQNINLEIYELYNASNLASLCMTIIQKKTDKNYFIKKEINDSIKAPISLFQQEIWPFVTVNPQTFNIPFVLNLHGDLNIKALEYSLSILLYNHSALRTTFIEEENIIYQIVNKYKRSHLKVIDYSYTKDHSLVTSFIKRYIKKKFIISQDNPIRFLLIQNDASSYLLVLVLHHIILDGWSVDIIIHDLCFNYNQYLKKGEQIITRIPISGQYIDFSLNQLKQAQSLLSKMDREEFKKFFSALHGNVVRLPGLNNFTIDKISAQKSFVEIMVKLDFLNVKQFAMAQYTTVGIVILTIFKCILYNYSQQKNITINFPVTIRPSYQEEYTIGYFVNMFTISTQFYRKITFKEVLEQVKNNIDFIKKYQNIPYKYLVEQLNLKKRIPSKCNIMFVSQNNNREKFNFNNLNASLLNYEPKKVLHDILAELFESNNELTLILTLRKQLVNTHIKNLFINTSSSLQNMINNIDIPIKDLFV